LKPANVHLGESGAVKVLDLGLALVSGAGAAGNAGTPAYMSPEQWRGEPEDSRSDVWSAGVILYEMLAGARPSGVSSGSRAASAAEPPRPVLRGPLLPGVPEAVRRVVARALAEDRGARLADGGALFAALLEAERALGAGRRRMLWAALAAGAVAAAGAGAVAMRFLGSEVRPERVGVAIADAVNQTGDPELDGVSGLVATSLEQSPRLSVLGRGRLFDLLRQEGRSEDRIDEGVARDLARHAGARTVLVPRVRRDGAKYAVEVAAVDARSGERLFAVSDEGAQKAEIPAVLDRVSGKARQALRESAPDVKASRVEIAQAVTASLEAYQHFYAGQACMDRPSRGTGSNQVDCAAHFRRALQIDPGFALAHYELALLAGFESNSVEQQRALLAPALRNLDRVPPKERQIILAYKAQLDGDDTTALSIYRAVAASWPDDKRGVYLQADLLHHRGDLAEAVPLLERVLAMDPEFEFALDHAIEDLGYLGQRERLAAIATRLERAPPTAATLHALGQARGWLGDAAGAVDAARQAVASGGGDAARSDLVSALTFAGSLDAAEAEVRTWLVTEPRSAPVQWRLVRVLTAQGRRREALALANALVRNPTDDHRITWIHVRTHFAVGLESSTAVVAQVNSVAPLDPETASALAVEVAYAGDLGAAARFAKDLPKGSPIAELYRAVALLRSGEPGRAADVFATLPLGTHYPVPKDAPVFLLGEALARAGRDAQAVDALGRFEAIYHPAGFWRCWAVPKSRILRARALDRVGRRAEARTEVDTVLRQLARADSDFPVLQEARTLGKQLAAPAQSVPASPGGSR
jgi:tetratricopeptide (TPR) repeat protein/TolB-like protein